MIVPNPTDAAAERAQAGPATLLSRRQLLVAAGGLALTGCTATKGTRPAATAPVAAIPERYRLMYGPLPNERFPIPAADLTKIDPVYFRQLVAYSGPEPVGTIVVDTGNRFLYLVRENGTAMRYGIGIGREGFAWDGAATIELKREWPTWTPPAEMIAREPELEEYRFGMDPGLDNPLGARALYLFQNGRDTLYRLHGTIEDWSIGRAVSSGCVRLLNQDVIDLYERVPVGSRVVVLPSAAPPALG